MAPCGPVTRVPSASAFRIRITASLGPRDRRRSAVGSSPRVARARGDGRARMPAFVRPSRVRASRRSRRTRMRSYTDGLRAARLARRGRKGCPVHARATCAARARPWYATRCAAVPGASDVPARLGAVVARCASPAESSAYAERVFGATGVRVGAPETGSAMPQRFRDSCHDLAIRCRNAAFRSSHPRRWWRKVWQRRAAARFPPP